MRKIICDRCEGEVIAPYLTTNYLTAKVRDIQLDIVMWEIDLCYKCTDVFTNWIKRGTTNEENVL